MHVCTESIMDNSNDFDVISDDELESNLEMHLQAWKEHAQDRPLRLLVCGLGGVGKSTLVNRLLQLGDEKWAEEGMEGGATTAAVSKFDRTTERGIKVCIFDTPGFSDIDISDEEIVAMMETKIESKLDLVLYCISLARPARVQQADVNALRLLTQAFSTEIWKKAVIVLTFANKLAETKKNAADYSTVVHNIQENLNKALRKNIVSDEIISQLSIVTAGHIDPILKYEGDKAWDDHLFLVALARVDPSLVPALLQCRWSWRDFKAAVVGGGSGVAVAGGAGAAIGAGIGVVGGPIGIGIGAAVGGAAGAAVGGATGISGGLLVSQIMRIKTIIKIKYKKWQLQKKSKETVPSQVSDQEPPSVKDSKFVC